MNGLEGKLGHCFKNTLLLKNALIHTSHNDKEFPKDIDHFQRLEFLGDSVYNLLTSEYLYTKFPFFSEGKLSKIKSIIVSKCFLIKLAESINLKEYIILGKGANLIRGKGKFSILADCMEACLGALFLDGGLKPCKKITHTFLNIKAPELVKNHFFNDYKSLFQEYSQKKYNCLPQYQLLKEKGPDHQKIFFVSVFVNHKHYADGYGNSKKEAEKNAAKKAISKIM